MNVSRREFLAAAAATATSGRIAPLSASPPSDASTTTIEPDVVQVSSNFVVRGRIVHKTILQEMLDLSLRRLTGTSSLTQAWRSLLQDDDLIGLKFNSSGAQGLGVGEKFADAVITSLVAAGFTRQQIVPIEAPDSVYERHGVTKPVQGWASEPTDFGSGRDQLAAVLDQVTAIINLPFLKTHNIAGITGCLKNLSHGLIKHPARFHASHCSPYIADIVSLPQIHGKLRLHLVNALRVVFDGGPEARHEFLWDAGIVLASRDPVASDTIGLNLINSQRSMLALPDIDYPVRRTTHLLAAEILGLGQANSYRIELEKLQV